MKKNLFLTLILALIVFMPSVKADVDTTQLDVIKPSSTKNIFDENYYFGYYSFTYVGKSTGSTQDSINHVSSLNLIPVEGNTSYVISVFRNSSPYSTYSNLWIYCFDSDRIFIQQISNNSSFVTPENCRYLLFSFNRSNIKTNISSYNVLIEKGTSGSDYVAYEETSEPVVDPEPEPLDGQVTILTNFYSIYLDKLRLLNDTAINNYLFLSFVAIIFLFALVEIFFYMCDRR